MIKEYMFYNQKRLKQVLNHALILKKKVHRVVKLNQEACSKLFIDMNPELRKNTEDYFEKYFFKLVNSCWKNYGKCKKTYRY